MAEPSSDLAVLRVEDAVPATLHGFDAAVVPVEVLVRSGDPAMVRSWVEGGATLLATVTRPVDGTGPPGQAWAELLGVTASRPGHSGEWFARVAAPDHPVVLRAQPEFPVTGTLVPLVLTASQHATVLVTASVAYRDDPVLVEHRVGAGRVISCGLEELGPRRPGEPSELSRILGRAVRPRQEERGRGAVVGVGIVGFGRTGGIGHAHGLAVQATPGLELVAVCDLDPDGRKDAEQAFADVRTYAEFDDFLADGDVAMVIVATPPTSHVELGLTLLRHGRHVVMEKPLCFTVSEADALTGAAREAGVALTVHQNRRWDPDFVALRQLVHDGALGELFNVETFVGGFDHPCRAWHSEASISGGAAYDWGSHHLDWILLLMGSAPSLVSCVGHKRVWHDVTNLDQERIRLLWDDGREAEFVHSDVAAVRRPKFYVQGTRGTLVGTYRPRVFERVEPGLGLVSEAAHHAEAPADLRLVTYAGSGALVDTAVPLAPERRFAFHRNLADHVLDGFPLAVTAASVRPVIAVLEAARRSLERAGQPVPSEA
ncbi:MAG TPA: Gfo/Idh/MocA family oxidoreductase [Acidimicrobiales bacterium]|nr:Gfo/Idh/MocA family oxidoreductase [Acidimicrobiales bacterium]